MKRIMATSLIVLAVMFSSTDLLAQNMGMQSGMRFDSTYGPGMMGGQYGYGMIGGRNGYGMMGMMQGYMQNMMNQPMRRMMMSVYILPNLNNLKLSVAQQTKLNGIKSDYMQKIQNAYSSMMNSNSILSIELNASTPDLNKMHKMIDQRSKAQGDRLWLTVRTYHDMMGVLTPDQQKQFKGMSTTTFMNSMINNMSVAQMMSMHQMMYGSGMGMMNWGMMNRGFMNGIMKNPSR